jgi:hypothetical protein
MLQKIYALDFRFWLLVSFCWLTWKFQVLTILSTWHFFKLIHQNYVSCNFQWISPCAWLFLKTVKLDIVLNHGNKKNICQLDEIIVLKWSICWMNLDYINYFCSFICSLVDFFVIHIHAWTYWADALCTVPLVLCHLCSKRLCMHIHAWIKVDLSSYVLLKGDSWWSRTLSILHPDLSFIAFSICCGFAFSIQTNLTVCCVYTRVQTQFTYSIHTKMTYE